MKSHKLSKIIFTTILSLFASIAFLAMLSEGADGGVTLVNFAGIAGLLLAAKGLTAIDKADE